MNKLFIFFLAVCITNACYAQRITIDGKEGNRPLLWKNFKGKPESDSYFFANTYWQMAFKFSNVSFRSDTAILKGFEVNLDFDPQKSWVKKDKASNDLLKHEQGHFDIAIICQREIIYAFNNTIFVKAGMQEKVNALFNSILNKYKDMERKYDDETNHSIDTAQQEKWDQFIKDELARTAALK